MCHIIKTKTKTQKTKPEGSSLAVQKYTVKHYQVANLVQNPETRKVYLLK